VLTPILQENLEKSQSRNEALFNEVKDVIEKSASDVARSVMDHDTCIWTELSSQLPSVTEQDRALRCSSFTQPPSRTRRDDILKPLTKPAAIQKQSSPPLRSALTRARRIWSHYSSSSWIGTARLEVRRTKRGVNAKVNQHDDFDITISLLAIFGSTTEAMHLPLLYQLSE
jgi:hypothetical protein